MSGCISPLAATPSRPAVAQLHNLPILCRSHSLSGMRDALCPMLALLLLSVLLCCLLPVADCAGRLQSFGMGYSQYAIYDKETPFFSHNLSSTAEFGVMTHFWATGADPAQIDTAVWRYYIDGEREASVQFQSAMVAGVGFADTTAPWGNKWMGKGAAGAAWYNNLSAPQPPRRAADFASSAR